jgi:hypothetical protein
MMSAAMVMMVNVRVVVMVAMVRVMAMMTAVLSAVMASVMPTVVSATMMSTATVASLGQRKTYESYKAKQGSQDNCRTRFLIHDFHSGFPPLQKCSSRFLAGRNCAETPETRGTIAINCQRKG